MVSILSYYESISQISAKMVEAARRSDWDALLKCEAMCAQIIGELRARSDELPFDDREKLRKAELIRQVLAHDAEIRDQLNPWLAELRNMLQTRSHAKRVEQAYQKGQG